MYVFRRIFLICCLAALVSVAAFAGVTPPPSVDRTEHVYAQEPSFFFTRITNAFAQHFNMDGYLYSHSSQFTWDNDNYVDSVDLSFYCGHGFAGEITTQDGAVYFQNAGNYSDQGYGTVNSEFLILYSCKVVATRYDNPDQDPNWSWKQYWVKEDVPGYYDGTYDVFDKLHAVIGFRTNADAIYGINVADCYGEMLHEGGDMWGAWNICVNMWGKSGNDQDKASAIFARGMYGEDYDSYYSDPAKNDTYLYNIFHRKSGE